MSRQERETVAESLLRWKRTGERLDAIRRRELRGFDFAEHRERVDDLLRIGLGRGKPRRTSGLIELQRLLRKLGR